MPASAIDSTGGVSLFTTDSAMPASEVTPNLGSRIALKRAVQLTFNRAAIESKLITIELEGKTYRYVGSKKVTGDVQSWNGRNAEGSSLWVGCSQVDIGGQFAIGPRRFLILSSAGEPVLDEVEWQIRLARARLGAQARALAKCVDHCLIGRGLKLAHSD
jgi:hypothetical protein